jgi:hypothetical protein
LWLKSEPIGRFMLLVFPPEQVEKLMSILQKVRERAVA